MSVLEIILRLIDKLLTAISTKKAQNERDKLEQSPDLWFSQHFNGGVQSTENKTDKANAKDFTEK